MYDVTFEDRNGLRHAFRIRADYGHRIEYLRYRNPRDRYKRTWKILRTRSLWSYSDARRLLDLLIRQLSKKMRRMDR